MNFVNRSLKGILLKNALRYFLYEKKRKTDFLIIFLFIFVIILKFF